MNGWILFEGGSVFVKGLSGSPAYGVSTELGMERQDGLVFEDLMDGGEPSQLLLLFRSGHVGGYARVLGF